MDAVKGVLDQNQTEEFSKKIPVLLKRGKKKIEEEKYFVKKK